jgi:hypothetical protein
MLANYHALKNLFIQNTSATTTSTTTNMMMSIKEPADPAATGATGKSPAK